MEENPAVPLGTQIREFIQVKKVFTMNNSNWEKVEYHLSAI
jgi:hypothetical protein